MIYVSVYVCNADWRRPSKANNASCSGGTIESYRPRQGRLQCRTRAHHRHFHSQVQVLCRTRPSDGRALWSFLLSTCIIWPANFSVLPVPTLFCIANFYIVSCHNTVNKRVIFSSFCVLRFLGIANTFSNFCVRQLFLNLFNTVNIVINIYKCSFIVLLTKFCYCTKLCFTSFCVYAKSSFSSSHGRVVFIVWCLLLCRCGKCRRYLKLIMAKPVRLHCASCDETLSVPQNCNIRLYKELRCPLDDYELLYCTTGTSGKVFVWYWPVVHFSK